MDIIQRECQRVASHWAAKFPPNSTKTAWVCLVDGDACDDPYFSGVCNTLESAIAEAMDGLAVQHWQWQATLATADGRFFRARNKVYEIPADRPDIIGSDELKILARLLCK